jgi:plasmid stabilization system protein ParE
LISFSDHPALYGLFYRDVRAVPLGRFPYVLYYRPEPNCIRVIAVQHARRSTRAWQGRV